MTAEETILSGYSKAIIKKAAQIKVLAFDVDGVLTDGKIIYSSSGAELKAFNVRDGLIISHLKKAGLITGIISGRESAAVTRRAVELKLDFCHQGIEDKAWAFAQILKHHKLKAKQVCFIGDDIIFKTPFENQIINYLSEHKHAMAFGNDLIWNGDLPTHPFSNQHKNRFLSRRRLDIVLR